MDYTTIAQVEDIEQALTLAAEEKHAIEQRFVQNFRMLIETLKAQKEVSRSLLTSCEQDGHLIF